MTLDPGRARDLGAKGIPEGSSLPIVLTVEIDESAMEGLYHAALTNKGGKAKSGALSVRRGALNAKRPGAPGSFDDESREAEHHPHVDRRGAGARADAILAGHSVRCAQTGSDPACQGPSQ